MPEPSKAATLDPQPDPNEKLVKVFDTEQESEAIVVKGLLESAGIESNLTSIATVQDAFPGLGGVVLMAREEDAEAARRIIAASQPAPGPIANQQSDDDETCEIVVSTEVPPAKG
jgi:hypothetical protein